ncbi:MAG TPA: circularly permuted type 2 ATP-grasp protein [Solirubrobacteraceae bacterium]|nr:circularly permuted type 2 ATP-grasp protein [Solirubrobacteraceae bacterium]
MTTSEPIESLAYRPLPGLYDEMVDASGQPRAHWSFLASAFADLGTRELHRRQAEAARLLDQDGVVYNVYGEGSAAARRRWRLDPVPTVMSSREWESIESGVIERAELLNLILDDIYGKRTLLERRLLPPEIVYAHAGFLRACDGIRLGGRGGGLQLFNYAADIARDGDGRCVVVADRTQAPSGSGYALENRTVIQRVLPSLYRDSQVHRLAPFFRTLRLALKEVAPPFAEDPRIVVLTPGPLNETAFEHAVLASSLGYPLVEGRDLTVRGGRVWMRSVGRLEPVDVILRRVDGIYCDPLELKRDSQLGVPGLVEAARGGAVSIVNTLGSSVLENPALMAFLPRLAEYLLGAPLRLENARTWWCGEDESRRYVLERLPELVIRPISRQAPGASILGSELSEDELESLRRRIESRPRDWVGSEALSLSGAPTLTADGLEPRRSVLRAFAVARSGSYVVMPGGLTRVSPQALAGRISSQVGAIAKDTWVLSSEPEPLTGFWLQPGPAVDAVNPMSSIPSRTAENLWWLGRYAERAEALTRLLRAVQDRRNEFENSASAPGVETLRALLETLTHITSTYPGFTDPALLADPGQELLALIVDGGRAGTLAQAIRALLACAYAVRDQLSGDTWLIVGPLERAISELDGDSIELHTRAQSALQEVMRSLLVLGGLGIESMVRDIGWRFMDAGRRIERGVQLLTLLGSTVTRVRGTATDSLMLESVLTAAESIITYRFRYRSRAQLETVLELLLLDAGNPRSLAYQLDRLTEDLEVFPTEGRLSEEQRLVLAAYTDLRLADPAALVAVDASGQRPELQRFLGGLLAQLTATGDAVDRAHFVHVTPTFSLVGAAGATSEIGRAA